MNSKGYTFIELAVVVFLISIMLTIAVPTVRDALLTDDLQSVNNYFMGITGELRSDAVREQIDYVLVLDLNNNQCWTFAADMTPEKKEERRKKVFRLPSDVVIRDVIVGRGDIRSTGEVSLRFSRKGYAQPAVIHLAKDERSSTIVLDAFMNRVNTYDKYLVPDYFQGGGSDASASRFRD